MGGVIKREAFIFENEVLRSGAGVTDILSTVLDATKVNTTFSGVAGRYIVPQGAVMYWTGDPYDSKVAPAFMNNGQSGQFALDGSGSAGAWQQADIAGILTRTIELIVGDGAVADESDTDASLFHLGCDFNINKLYGYGGTGNPSTTLIQAALSHCLFR